MKGPALNTIVTLVLVVGYAGGAAWRGFVRRREHWTGSSWIGFGMTLLMSAGMVAFPLVFSAALDNHAPWVGVRGSNTRAALIVAALGGLVGGTLIGTLAMSWFAKGNPEQPFPRFWRHLRAVRRLDRANGPVSVFGMTRREREAERLERGES